ncbi:hypothetical protein ACFOJ6_03415 [Gordonia humi]
MLAAERGTVLGEQGGELFVVDHRAADDDGQAESRRSLDARS